MMPGNGQVSVPPGFRFHPTDEELLYYYLRKKVAYEAIDLDVIRDVDLNKLEPWDLKDRCRIGSGPQTEWYFFSHKDKKYPTGTRTNRATTAGFWKATGRDKAIHLNNSKRIGMRKTLVFYTGRAPHGQKTDWIMHEYRLDDDNVDVQEEGWVVCRVFKKKNHQTAFQVESSTVEEVHQFNQINQISGSSPSNRKHNFHMPYDPALDNSMHLPQLLSTESIVAPSFLPPISLSSMDVQCSQNLMRLTGGGVIMQEERINGEWSFLDKLLASHHCLEQLSSVQRLPFQYIGYGADFLKFSKYTALYKQCGRFSMVSITIPTFPFGLAHLSLKKPGFLDSEEIEETEMMDGLDVIKTSRQTPHVDLYFNLNRNIYIGSVRLLCLDRVFSVMCDS